METEAGKALPAQALYRACAASELPFESTEELAEFHDLPGQERAMEAIHLATDIEVEGYNLFVLGPAGAGRHSVVRQFLKQRAATQAIPSDWCYVNNFSDPRRPRALSLPPGTSRQLREDLERLVQDAETAIPVAFESEDFQTQRESIEEEYKEQQEQALHAVEEEARGKGIGVVQTPTGIALVPLHEGKPMDPEDFAKLPEDEQKRIEADTATLTRELQHVMRSTPQRARETRMRLRELERQVAGLAVSGLVEDLTTKYRHLAEVVEYLQRMQADIVDNVALFLRRGERQGPPAAAGRGGTTMPGEDLVTRRYSINAIVDRSELRGAPVVVEDQPTFAQLIGQIEHQAEFGALVTDFSLIRAGALHRANGGYLVLDAAKVLAYPAAWEGLKRALKSREIRVRSLGDDLGLISTVSLEPQAIPLNIKVILIGERVYYYLLNKLDPEFSDLFKIAADFEDEIGRNAENIMLLGRLLATVVRREQLRHLDREAVARIVEESARHAGDSERLSADVRWSTDLLREAHYWAGRNDKPLIGADEIQRAIDGRIRRASRYRDRLQEEMLRETLLVQTEGSQIGQINGLAVMQLGEFAFARPQRISATVSLGTGKVIDIERETSLGGPLHSKGVLILAGFLRSRYAGDYPLSLSASLVFEQSYGGVEGDSASAAELCALLSALAQLPLGQQLAMTGSIDQHGRIQAIGGVNEKIEGFFDICRQRGLNGDQGVLIPVANVKHLMLRRDVVEAVSAGRFHVYPIDTVDRSLELLTGLPAGEPDEHGEFPQGTVNQQIRASLVRLARERQAFARRDGGQE